VNVDPIRQTVTVHGGIDHAFAVFTDGVGGWWPVRNHSIGEDEIDTIVIEGHVGGRVLERWRDGREQPWGEVTAWDPPHRVAMTWHPNPNVVATAVEVVFEALGPASTRVQLVHSGWERLSPDDVPGRRDHYEQGWPAVLAAFGRHAADPDCHRAFARQTNQLVWALLAMDHRSADDNDTMLDAAHTSAYHWAAVGGPVEATRAQWLLSNVHAVLGRGRAASHHARRALDVCSAHGIGDFDLAYAYEAMGRAAAVSGDADDAACWRTRAAEAATAIAEPEDRALFESDLALGPWQPVGADQPA
jgi:uncharacterized protein YndB with AHSA1/START domain